jgi:SAM-dependent methyltransferase
MTSSNDDDPTLGYYAREAQAYAARPRYAPGRSRSATETARHIDAFLGDLPPGASVLELGCGVAEDTVLMRARGFNVRPTDGSPEMAREAAHRLGHPVDVLCFEDLVETAQYHGIWANACLLHVPRTSFGDILRRINRALKPGGALYASFKAGNAEGHDTLGRYYNYPDEPWLSAAFAENGAWRKVSIQAAAGNESECAPTPWLHVLARKV